MKAATKEGWGSASGRASDLEVKFVARMHLEEIKNAELVINMPGGPCGQPRGCDQSLNYLLGKDGKEKGLTVYFPKEDGSGWTCLLYGTHIVKGCGGRGGGCGD
ncbi:DddA-like double-stranded DNA deaminase toxin [Kitasatospora sp. NPDC086791]|uniref:DddA-like double-stranded DNA deaminase toxin n=1 Tax=Kitasatospora sp. NPDC086791 TaxID=3155178 RepID=UPI00343A5F71